MRSAPRLLVPLAPLALVAAAFTVACGPIGPLPGRALRGPVHTGALPDWSFVHEVKTIQLETRPERPYSVNVWCGAHEGRLYVPTSLILGPDDPNDREWVRIVSRDPRVRLRIDGTLYELRAVRVEDAAEREAVRAALLAKYDVESDEHARLAWIFRMEAR